MRAAKLCILLTCSSSLASAEFRLIELSFGGIDCASCAEFVQGKLARARGVESVTVDRAAGMVTVKLAPDNKVRLDQVRDFVQQSGFTPKDAHVRVRGAVASQDGGWVLRLPETGQTYRLKLTANQPPAEGKAVVVDGRIAAPEKRDAPEILEARLIDPAL